jgi:membrane-associated protease RseP (regulator of RpoE activity)
MGDVEVAVPGEDGQKPGVSVTRVQPDTPASRAGLQAGDVVISVDRTRWKSDVAASFSFQQAIMKRKPGDTVQLEIVRGAELMKVPVTLAARPMGLPEASKVPMVQGFQGFQGLQINPGIRMNFLQLADEELRAFEEKQKADEQKAKEDLFQAWLQKRRAAAEKP